MKTKISRASGMKLSILITVACLIVAGPALSDSKAANALRASVQAVQGDANVTVDRDQEPVKLTVGKMVDAWNTVSTNENRYYSSSGKRDY
jgi:hypothetical protein